MDTVIIRTSTEDDHTVYRWRYHAEGNHEDMGGSTQPYNTIEDCLAGILRVTGSHPPPIFAASAGTYTLHRPKGNLELIIDE